MTSLLAGRPNAKLLSAFVRLAPVVAAALVLSRSAAAQIPLALPAEPEPTPAAPTPDPAPAEPPAPVTPPAPLVAAPGPPVAAGTSAQPSSTARAAQLRERAAQAREEASSDDEADDAGLAPRRVWYGWQTLIADGASSAAVLAAAALNDGSEGGSRALVWAGLLGYELAPGIVHFVHENPGRAFASFGIRLGMPLAGAFVGAAAASGCSGYLCESTGAGAGFLLGMGGAIVLDAAVLAYDYPESTRAARLMPLVSVGPGRAWVGLGGEL